MSKHTPVAHIGVIRRCANPGAEHLSYPNCHPRRRKPSGHSQFHQPTCFQVRRGTCLSGQQSHISNARNALWHWDRVQPEMAGGSHVALSGLDNFTKCILALAETEQSGAMQSISSVAECISCQSDGLHFANTRNAFCQRNKCTLENRSSAPSLTSKLHHKLHCHDGQYCHHDYH